MTKSYTLKGFGCLPKVVIHRLYGLGLRKGVCIQHKHTAPLGCPVAVEVNGALISLRQSEFNELELQTNA